jgi:hypothetical protein
VAAAKKTAKKSIGKTAEPTPAADLAATFANLAETLRREGGVDPAEPESSPKKFGAGALKVGGKIFAMPAQGTLVLKLPAGRVDALVAAGLGTHFDPGHGRVMKEWVALRGGEDRWLALAREARAFVLARG